MKWPALRRSAAARPAAGPDGAVPVRAHAGGLGELFVERVLVIEADGLGARAAVAARRGGQWRLGAWVRSRRGQPRAQADELLAALAAAGERKPRRALLLSSACVPALLDLPVDPQRPRPEAQMREMVRYELEMPVAQHNSLWTVGEVLYARGVLDAGQRRRVVEAMEQRRQHPQEACRFGEIAIAEALADRKQIDAALECQQAQQILDSDLACGWCAVPQAEGLVHDGPRWFGAACAPAWREAWREALADAGVRLQALAPRLLLPALGSEGGARTRLVVEIRPEQIVRMRRRGPAIDGFDAEPRLERAVDAGWIADSLMEWSLDEPEALDLVVSDGGLDAATVGTLVAELQARLRVPCALCADGPGAAAALAAAAWLADRDRERERRQTPEIAARMPLPPPWKTRGGRQALGVAAVLLALVGWEGQARWELARMEGELEHLRTQARARSEDTSAQDQLRARELSGRLEDRRKELAAVLAEAERLEAIARRTSLVPELIRSLAAVIEPRIVLDAVRESAGNRDGIEVEAWSTSDMLAQRFARDVQEAVRPLGLGVAQADLSANVGRTGAEGFRIRFWLIPSDPDDLGAVVEAKP